MQPNTAITAPNESPIKSAATKIIMAITTLIFLGSGYCFSQSNKTEQMINTNIRQEERIAALEKRIAEAGDDFVSLTLEEYELLLSRPVGKVDKFESQTTVSGIAVGIGGKIFKTDIQVVFPFIPNIGAGEVFILFDFAKTVDGRDFLDRTSNTESNPENKENQFTELDLYERKILQKSYWFGSRYVNLREYTKNAAGELEDYPTVRTFSDMNFGTASGKIIINLPTNITGLTLAKGDIGVEKPFAGGVITLKEIKDDNISFQFTGDGEKIYAWTVYDDKNTQLDIKEVTENDGLYQLYAEHPQSVKVYQAEIVRKEYPFAFGNESHATSEKVSSVQEQKPAPSVQTKDTTMNNIQTKHVAPVYLDKNDPIFISIKGRALTDLKQVASRFDPESAESKLVKTWTKEKRNQLQTLGGKSIEDYTDQTHFDNVTFMLLLSVFGKLDQKKIVEEWDIRVQYFEYLGGDYYVAEFWEDGLAENSEDYVLAAALSTLASTGNPQERYFKVMALLYTLEKDGSIIFHDPFQPAIDLFKTIGKKPGGRPQGDL